MEKRKGNACRFLCKNTKKMVVIKLGGNINLDVKRNRIARHGLNFFGSG
jgi:hypothetical protein